MLPHLKRHLLGVRLKFERFDENENGSKTRHGTKRKQCNDSNLLPLWQVKLSNFNSGEDKDGSVDQDMCQYCREEKGRFFDVAFRRPFLLGSIPQCCQRQAL